jgi:protein-disulfide isomerase
MTLLRCLAVAAVTFALAVSAGRAADQAPTPLTPEQTEAVNKLVHDYLMSNPKVLTEAIEHAQDAAKEEADRQQQAEIVNRREELENDPTSPVLGDAKGDVTIVEFFDYRCPYCKASAPNVEALLAQDKKVRLVLKDFPILGKESTFASRIALAVKTHGKYAEFYRTLFSLKGNVDEATTLETVKMIGLDPEQIKKEADSSEIDDELKHNFDLAKAINIEGTPAFFIGETMTPGAVTLDVLKEQIAAQRAKKS